MNLWNNVCMQSSKRPTSRPHSLAKYADAAAQLNGSMLFSSDSARHVWYKWDCARSQRRENVYERSGKNGRKRLIMKSTVI